MTQIAAERLIERLTELGFSKYEARAYLGLLGSENVTGYALANATGIPQPKVYETLRRLSERGAAIKLSDDPAVFAALPADRLLEQLEAEFRGRLQAAQADFERIHADGAHEWHEPVVRMDGYAAVRSRAEQMIAATERKLYLSGWAEHLNELREPILEAGRRGVEIVVLHFGKLAFGIEHGQAFRHASTDGALYPHHRSRQLAVVPDSAAALWALAPDGDDWGGVYTKDQRLVMVVKAYLRHDIYVQKIYDHLEGEMHAVFGPALEFLTDVTRNDTLGEAAGPAPEDARRAAG
jgi:sugar-specific transcriptional regulator TrmB